MSTKLPQPLAAYFATVNVHDIDAMLAPFSEAAVVKDEAQERRGIAAIREWIEETTRKYCVMMAVTNVELRYAFILNGEKIARLEISW